MKLTTILSFMVTLFLIPNSNAMQQFNSNNILLGGAIGCGLTSLGCWYNVQKLKAQKEETAINQSQQERNNVINKIKNILSEWIDNDKNLEQKNLFPMKI